jgi:hypothetical protein
VAVPAPGASSAQHEAQEAAAEVEKARASAQSAATALARDTPAARGAGFGPALYFQADEFKTGAAQQHVNGATLRITVDMSIDGGPARHEEFVTRGLVHLAGLRDDEGQACEADLTPASGAGDTAEVSFSIVCGGTPLATPRMTTRAGQPATIAIGRTERQPDGTYRTTKGTRMTVRIDKV